MPASTVLLRMMGRSPRTIGWYRQKMTWYQRSGQATTLGRNLRNAIVLFDEHASRWHAEIVHKDGRVQKPLFKGW